MNENTVIKVEGLHKKFSKSLRRGMAYGTIDMLRNFIGIPSHNDHLRKSEFWALEDINFEIKKGDAVGILGINGSGKSTLLRMLSGIFPPDKGKITVKGTIGALIAVGAGFHPHMTGRENIFLNGTILGMKRKEIKDKFQNIVDFADIGGFLDAPVSTYSSGMRVRLGFAIAVHSSPDILLIDEVLSVGDISFRNKSLRYMSEFQEKANALVFVSHDIEQVRVLCERVIILDKGKVIFDGPTHEGVVKYEELSRGIRFENYKSEMNKLEVNKLRRGVNDGETVKVESIKLVDKNGDKVEEVGIDDPLNFISEFELLKDVSSLSFYVSINRDDSELLAISVVSNENNKMQFKDLKAGKYKISCKIKEHHLKPGVYNPNITFRNDKTFETYQKIYSKLTFKIKSNGEKLERGLINVEEDWELKRF